MNRSNIIEWAPHLTYEGGIRVSLAIVWPTSSMTKSRFGAHGPACVKCQWGKIDAKYSGFAVDLPSEDNDQGNFGLNEQQNRG
jgi:hypothetical protein